MTSQADKIRESLKNHKWEPSRHYMDFHIAGFAYYDGLDVIDQLMLGQNVTLVVESDNPHDPEAVAIYFGSHKLGYVPSNKNSLLSTLLYYGHAAIFESRIQFVNLESHPERQFRVVVKIKDDRDAEAWAGF
ncbi:HIRAN domain-containing protein [Pseudolactococcus insecticola]|uniref:Restriction endonuclease n=1 Tax=Pseudolactococcus insecticola TaxID=2709158 RepID=A0A6A0B572_9LACT|nr:HIRAN domain-containing protein [Lactococcus insecticola]GFH40372.1 restriction endonuclease [Lactococcus insecticola]